MQRSHCVLIPLSFVCVLASASSAQVRDRTVRPAGTATMIPAPNRDVTFSMRRPMAPPTNLTATGTPATASLRWEAAPGAIGYTVTRTDATGAAVSLTPTVVATTSFDDVSGGVKPGLTYSYTVAATHPDGGVGTAQVSVTAPAAAVPAWVRVEPRGNESALVWAPVPGAGSYQIFETWAQPVYSTVYSANGTTVHVRVDYLTRTHVVAAPQSSLAFGAGMSRHRFDVGAAYPPSGVTAPRGSWPFLIVP